MIVFGIANLGLVLYGILLLWMPGVLFESLPSYMPGLPVNASWMASLLPLFRLIGYLNLLLGAAGLFLLWRYHRGRQSWLGFAIVILSMLSYLGPVIYDNTAGTIGVFEILEHILFAAMILTGLLMIEQFRIPEEKTK